jgi:hypothetical protein
VPRRSHARSAASPGFLQQQGRQAEQRIQSGRILKLSQPRNVLPGNPARGWTQLVCHGAKAIDVDFRQLGPVACDHDDDTGYLVAVRTLFSAPPDPKRIGVPVAPGRTSRALPNQILRINPLVNEAGQVFPQLPEPGCQ